MKTLMRGAVCALLLAWALPAGATIKPALQTELAGEIAPATPGERWSGQLRLTAGANGELGPIDLAGDGWSQLRVDGLPTGRELQPGEELTLDISALPDGSGEPLRLQVMFGGRHLETGFHLDAPHVTQARRPGSVVEDIRGQLVPHPGVANGDKLAGPPTDDDGPAPKDAFPELQEVFDEDHDTHVYEEGPQRAAAARNIRVRGRFVYVRDDNTTRGADNIRVQIYDEDSTWDELLYDGVANSDGYYDVTINWDPCFACDQQPDIYVVFSTNHSRIRVKRHSNGNTYSWATGTTQDYTGSDLNLGWLQPGSEGDMPAVHQHAQLTRVWRYIENAAGYNTPKVDCRWPNGSTGAFYNGEINMSTGREWREDTLAHEYGHHWVAEFGVQPSFDYCNGICDTDGCGHCIWCQEDTGAALGEGWPNWLADVYTRAHPGIYGYATMSTRSQEDLSTCSGSYDDPTITEGFLGALCRDIEDATQDDHSGYTPGDGWQDRLSMGINEIFTVMDVDAPQSPVEFLQDFRNRYPSVKENLWETAKNCGYDLDTTDPSLVSGLSSTSHSTSGDSPDNTISFSWTAASDDWSGVSGYGIYISGSAGMPGATQDIGPVTSYTTPALAPGTYYFNIRTVDRAGNWDSSYRSVGPYTIRAPDPANLAFELRPGWNKEVVPYPSGNLLSGSVPAPSTLPGNTQGTYWNFVVQNTGEVSTGTQSSAWAWMDGHGFLTLFNPPDYYDTTPNLGPGVRDYGMNQGPLFVRGGRHTFGVRLDFGGAVAETDETDNGLAYQWIWSPLDLTPNGEISRNTPPDRDGSWEYYSGTKWYNADGLRFSSGAGWWNAVWMYGEDFEDDFDLRLHPASTGPTDASGFASNVGYGSRAAGCLDAVLVNRNVEGTKDWDVGFIQAGADQDVGSAKIKHIVSSSFSFGDSTNLTMPGGDPMMLREFYVSSADTGFVSVTVDIDPAAGPVYALWLDETFAKGDLLDYDQWAVTDGDGRARLDFHVPDSGYNCLVLYRDPKDGGLSTPLDMVVEISGTPPDYMPLAKAGWHSPLVPRPNPDGTSTSVPQPSLLNGWTTDTYFNFAVRNDSPAPGQDDRVWMRGFLDDQTLVSFYWPGFFPAETDRSFNYNSTPFFVRGGRHTLVLRADADDVDEEIHEDNNIHGEQWIWSPQLLANDSPVAKSQPADRTAGWSDLTVGASWYNADGFRSPLYNTGNGYWAALAVMSQEGSDVDMRLHQPSTGAKDGFASNLGTSSWGSGQSDYVLVNMNVASERQLDMGVLDISGSGGYTALSTQSTFRGTNPSGEVGQFTMGAGDFVDLHEFYLEPGVFILQLRDEGSTVDWGVGVHGPDQSFHTKADVLDGDKASWFAGEGEDEWLSFEVGTTGYYAVAVWKTSDADLGESGDYTLRFGQATGVGDTPGRSGTALRSIVPNPFNPRTTVEFSLESATDTQLRVYTLRGEHVRTLHAGQLPAGVHEVVWDGLDDSGRQVSSGAYLVEMVAGPVHEVRKAILLK